MNVFDPLREFLCRRRAAKLNAKASAIQLVIERSESLRGNFVFPGPDITVSIHFNDHDVGRIDYGVSPLDDGIYISNLQIDSEFRRRGVGLAALWQLWRQYELPLTPMHEIGTSIAFWQKARRCFAKAGGELKHEIRSAELYSEQQRWEHLVPEPEHERLIRELKESPEWPAIEAKMKASYGSSNS